MVRKIALIFLVSVIFPFVLFAEQPTAEERFRTEYLATYPDASAALDSFIALVRHLKPLFEDSLFYTAAGIKQALADEINKYGFYSRSLGELNILYCLVKIDAALDYFLLGDKRSGTNKNYLMSYIIGRYDAYGFLTDRPLSGQERIKGLADYYTIGGMYYGTRSNWISQSSLLGCGYGYNYFMEELDAWFLVNELTFFRVFFSGDKDRYTDAEYEVDAAVYVETREDDIIWGNFIPRELLYDYLATDLFYMSDYHDDITVYSRPNLMELCTRVRDCINPQIPVREIAGDWWNDSVMIAVTYRREKALAFFNQYYGNSD
jgi:hypothetical protein